MARPDVPGTPMTDYEEVWRYLPIREAGQGSHVSWILESDHGVLGEGRYNIIKVFLGRVGGMFLALYQEQVHERSRRSGGEWDVRITGGNVSARREEWTGRWEVKYLLGQNSGDLPSMARGLDRKPQKTWYAGGAVTIGGKQYIVRAFEDMARVSKL